MAHQLKIALAILRLEQVEVRTGLKKSSIYKKSSEGAFPTPVKLGTRAVGWIESEIDEWIATQIEKSRTVPAAATVIVGERMRAVAETAATSEILSHKILPQPLNLSKTQSPPTSARAESPPGSNIASSKKGRRRDV